MHTINITASVEAIDNGFLVTLTESKYDPNTMNYDYDAPYVPPKTRKGYVPTADGVKDVLANMLENIDLD